MKATCTQENLARSLSFLERATGKQSTLPILSNLLLVGENGKMKLSATNLEIGVTSYISAKLEGNGEIAAPVKILANFVQNIPQGDIINIDLEGNSLSLRSGGYSLRVRGLDSKDFPIIPEKKGDYMLSIPAQVMKSILSKLLPCVSVNESRIELTGVNFLFHDEEIHIAATDSFRLAEYVMKLQKEFKYSGYEKFLHETQSLIIPQMALQELSRLITPETENVEIAFEENQVFFGVNGALLVSRVINGKYPDYKQILPKNYLYSTKIRKEELLRSVRMASVFSSQMNGEMFFGLDPKNSEIIISSHSTDIGENKTVLKGEIQGSEALQILFNPKYVLDGLGIIDDEYIVFSANSNSTPVAFQSSDPNFMYIAMPIRK